MVTFPNLFRQALLWAAPFFFIALSLCGAERPPNIVFILTDDQGWFDVGINGNKTVETPALDQLAREGVRFTHFYATPVCTPTRAGILTGRYPQRSGAIDTYLGRDTLAEGEITVAQLLQKQGYRTGIFGKWHLGRYMKYHPNERGFDEFYGFWQYGFINRYMDSDELWLNKEKVLSTGYITDDLTSQAIGFLKRNKSRPFFLYLPYNAPHDPHLVNDSYIDRYLKKGVPLADARIYGMIHNLDENVRRVLNAIEEQGLRENTIVVFMTDNGGVSKYDKCGLRGNKGSVYEGGIRVPLFMRWPGKIAAGKTISAMAQFTDLFPTFLEIAGASSPQDRPIDGKTLWPLVQGQTTNSPHSFLFHQWSRVRPKRDENWAVRDAQFKLVNGELYDLRADPGESHNLAKSEPERVQALRKHFEVWFTEVTAGMNYTNRPAIQIGRGDENPVELDVTWSAGVGTHIKPTYRRYIRDAIINWRKPSDYVQWSVEVVEPGEYEVTLVYGCEPGDEGSTFTVKAGTAELRGTTEKTNGQDLFITRWIGTLKIDSDVKKISIHGGTLRGTEIMALHKVWLKKLD